VSDPVEAWKGVADGWRADYARLRAECDRYRNALERIKAQQPETLETIRRNGFVFDSIGHEPGNWQHLAFTIYNDLCSVDSIACDALKEQA
jgi:hypothetical protein